MNQIYQQAIAFLKQSNIEGAINLLKSHVNIENADPRILRIYAECNLHQKELKTALNTLMHLTRIEPDNAVTLNDIAGVHFQLGNFDEALEYFTQATSLDPGMSKAWHFLGICFAQKNQMGKAYECFTAAEESDPLKLQIENAYKVLESGDIQQSLSLAEQILAQSPSNPRGLHIIAMVMSYHGNFEKAVQFVQQALKYSPYNLSLWSLFTQLSKNLADYEQAMIAAKRLIEYEPTNIQNYVLLTGILVDAGQFEEAVHFYHQMLNNESVTDFTHLQLGHTYKTLGDTEKCIQHYEQCTDSADYKGAAYWGLANISEYIFSDQQISKISALLSDPDVNQEQACQLGFALGRIYEQRHDFEASYAAYASANLNKGDISFNPAQHSIKLEAVKTAFSAELFGKFLQFESSTVTPIFIVGMPRAGSTLVEQILASHSKVEATMELKTLPAIARRAYKQSCYKNNNNSGDLSLFTSQDWQQLGDLYLELSAIYRTNKPYFIDKLPPNFQHVGLIQLILPSAIIIDVRRHPMACGFGIFKQYFAKGHEYAYNQAHIASYYSDYLKLMEHWQKVLPNKVYQLSYESLVKQPEVEIKTLLAHCKLDFEDACLSPHKTSRYVRTASSDQVRKPINDQGLNQWCHYRKDLSVLENALGAEILEQF
jgi:tetratricopeptide (TPR) repeat protein